MAVEKEEKNNMWAILIIAGALIYGIVITCVEAFQTGCVWLGIIVTLYFIFWIIFLSIWG